MMADKPSKISRRQFIKIAGVLGGGALLAGGGFLLKNRTRTKVASVSDVVMSTYVTVTIHGANNKEAETTARAAISRMKNLEKMLTRFDNSGLTAQLNKSKTLHNIPNDMKNVVQAALSVQQQSNGAFDPAVLPMLNAVKNNASLKSRTELKALAGDGAWTFNGNSVKLRNNDTALTFDGIAKGYIIDEGVKILANRNVKNLLLDAGGDMSAIGMNPSNRPWNIGIQNPRGSGIVASLKLSGKAVATSGDYDKNNRFNGDYSRHHLINPFNAKSACESRSATVVAANAMLADAWSTALFVLGADKGLKLIETIEGVEGLVITNTGQIRYSRQFPIV